MNWPRPGEPFWVAFTAFCANEVAQFALDKLDVLTIERVWVATLGSVFVAGAVYGREKVAELKRRKNGNGPHGPLPMSGVQSGG